MSALAPARDATGSFPHTSWSQLVAATREPSPESAAALEAICRAYWQPLYVCVRRCGQPPHDAQDLTQEFFAQLLEKRWLESADRGKGRLRTFLIVALKRFMAKAWRKTSTQRRGGGLPAIVLDTTWAESSSAADSGLAPDEMFDRQWALTLLERTLHRLEAESNASGRVRDFSALKACLMAARGAIDYAAVAEKLGGNAGAARVAAHRLRKRFREVYREEISQTLAEGADVEAELRHLAAALARA